MITTRLLVCAAALTAAACSTTAPPAAAPAPVVAAAPVFVPAPAPAPAAHPAPVAPEESAQHRFLREQAALDRQSVYFDFDRSTVRSDEADVVSRHANLSIAYPQDRVVLQGNCDERGGREYNLALGQKRAEAVKQRLALLGVPAARVETVSFGKEKPRETCHAEKCWSVDRRVDFVDEWK